jgi:xylan 1,4-beta-xylosidase
VGEDGKRYLHFDGGMAVELAADGLSVIGQPEQVFQGWRFPEEWSTECFCLRSPKIVSRNGQYYLTASQGGSGGTPSGHMVISARSKSPLGPWEQSPYNPVIRTVRDEEPWWSKGIATIFDAGEGRWFAVYNAYRRNERKMGQQVIVEPITWTEEGWFHLTEPDKDQFRARTIRNHAIADDTFTSSELSLQWQLDASQFAPEYVLKDGQLLLPSQAKKLTVLYAQASDWCCTSGRIPLWVSALMPDMPPSMWEASRTPRAGSVAPHVSSGGSLCAVTRWRCTTAKMARCGRSIRA